jgi:uncharacterized membrane protein YgaE (UPF0421/DUF939 family)
MYVINYVRSYSSSGRKIEMDPNLTNPIIINATLNQPSQGLLSNPAVTALLGIAFGGILNILFFSYQEKTKIENRKRQKKKQIYSRLRGAIESTEQAYNNFGEIQIMYRLYKTLYDRGVSSHRDKAKNYEQKVSEEMERIANTRQQLWEIIGLIEVSFPPSDTLKSHLETICKIEATFESKREEVKTNIENASNDELLEADLCKGNLRKQAFETLTNVIKNSCTSPLYNLANWLLIEIKDEEEMLKKRPFWKIW